LVIVVLLSCLFFIRERKSTQKLNLIPNFSYVVYSK
jgi:hypothetical protein